MTEPKDPPSLGQPVEGEGAPAGETVPAAFVAQRLKTAAPAAGKPDPKSLEALRNRPVEVHAGAIIYRGILVGADSEEVYLRTELRYTSVALERVSRVLPTDVKPPPLQPGTVDPGFYKPMPGDEEEG